MKWQVEHLAPAYGNIPAGEVLNRCEENDLSHFPVVENGIFRGMVRCEDLENFPLDTPMRELYHLLENFYATGDNDWTNLFALFLANETNILPVLDEHGLYNGVIFLEDILMDLSEI